MKRWKVVAAALTLWCVHSLIIAWIVGTPIHQFRVSEDMPHYIESFSDFERWRALYSDRVAIAMALVGCMSGLTAAYLKPTVLWIVAITSYFMLIGTIQLVVVMICAAADFSAALFTASLLFTLMTSMIAQWLVDRKSRT